MTATRHRFGDFVLDTADRSLRRDGAVLGLNARYFDALVLLVRESGRLVPKQRFFDEVWAGSVVTDAALTQCIKELRRTLGDDAGEPRFVRTVAGHGYCFIAPVSNDGAAPAPSALPPWLLDTVAALAGGAAAGVLGGLLYGSVLAVAPGTGLGRLSVLLVLMVLSILVGLTGALGVGLGLGLGRQYGKHAAWLIAGPAIGGCLIGGLAHLLAADAFTLLTGHAPQGITGGLEGAFIGAAFGVGLLWGRTSDARRLRPVAYTALTTGIAGALIPLFGGSLMATSLARAAATFDDSRLDMAPLGMLFGEPQLGLAAQMALGGVEVGLFGACVAGAGLAMRRA